VFSDVMTSLFFLRCRAPRCAVPQTLARKYETRPGFSVHMPDNNETVALEFEESRLVKIIGELVRAVLSFS
jgi:hypothetical protein